jgi:hypothetical protein
MNNTMFSDFQPDKAQKQSEETPFFDDINVGSGWEGMTTQKSFEKLNGEIREALGFLGAEVTSFMRGKFGQDRQGYRISFVIVSADGTERKGQIDVAALPCRPQVRYRRGGVASLEKRQEQSLKAALFNIRDILEGMYRMRFIQPGFDPMMAWTLTDQGKTVMQLWNERMSSDHLLPAGKEEEFIDAEVKEVK